MPNTRRAPASVHGTHHVAATMSLKKCPTLYDITRHRCIRLWPPPEAFFDTTSDDPWPFATLLAPDAAGTRRGAAAGLGGVLVTDVPTDCAGEPATPAVAWGVVVVPCRARCIFARLPVALWRSPSLHWRTLGPLGAASWFSNTV